MMKKIFIMCLLVIFSLFFVPEVAYAKVKSFTVVDSSNSDYNYNLRVININSDEYDNIGIVGQSLKDYLFLNIPNNINRLSAGFIEWENPEYIIKEGLQTVNIVYSDLVTKDDVIFSVEIIGVPCLTVNNLILNKSESFNINIIGKLPNSTYNWFSDNKDMVSVSPNGIVNGKNIGTTNVTCEITFQDGEIIKLTCLVTIIEDITE